MIKNHPYFNPKREGQTEEAPANIVEHPPVEEAPVGPSIEIEPGLTSIIVPAYFKSYPIFHATGNCIGAIREHTDSAKTPYEIIFVQNGNTGIGFTQDNASKSYAEKVIFNEENLGYAKAVNQAIRIAKGEFIAIVNNDVQVFDHWLEDLQQCLKSGVDLIQAYPMYGLPYGRAIEARDFRNETIVEGAVDDIKKTLDDFRDFSCVLTWQQLFVDIGLFDERFKVYGEDLDMVRRIEKAGGTVKSTKRVRVHHIIGMTSSEMPETPEIMNESKALLKEIWGE